MTFIEVDGGYLESGGQIVRTAVGLSAITGNPCKIINIRKGRCKPGLMSQHLSGVEACARICGGKLKNAKLGSCDIEFHPGEILGGEYSIDVGTAGSIPLVLQTIALPAIYSQKDFIFKITGGTHVHWSPTMDYFQYVFCDFMKKMGVDVSITINKYGFYPKGGGEVAVEIKSSNIKNIDLKKRGYLNYVDVTSTVTKDLQVAKVAERQVEGFDGVLKITGDRSLVYVNSSSTGSSICGHAQYDRCRLGATVIGERGKKAEFVGEECANELKISMDSGACLDNHMADQLLPFMAIACMKNGGINSVSVEEITGHVKTNIWTIEKFLPVKFDIVGKVIDCRKI
jgi:RNA 3'-phosphate cyclase